MSYHALKRPGERLKAYYGVEETNMERLYTLKSNYIIFWKSQS